MVSRHFEPLDGYTCGWGQTIPKQCYRSTSVRYRSDILLITRRCVWSTYLPGDVHVSIPARTLHLRDAGAIVALVTLLTVTTWKGKAGGSQGSPRNIGEIQREGCFINATKC